MAHRSRPELAAKRATLEEQLEQLAAPEPGSNGFGKRVGEGTSHAVERITAVSAEEKLQAMVTDVGGRRRSWPTGPTAYATRAASRSRPGASKPVPGRPAA